MAHKIIYEALLKKYEADIADASAKITILMTETRIIPEHIDSNIFHNFLKNLKKIFLCKMSNTQKSQ
jgi:hypothetical protein